MYFTLFYSHNDTADINTINYLYISIDIIMTSNICYIQEIEISYKVNIKIST